MGGPDKITKLKRIRKAQTISLELVVNINTWALDKGKTANISLLHTYMGQLNSHYNTFMKMAEESYVLIDDEEDIDMSDLLKIEEMYTTTKAILSECIEEKMPVIVQHADKEPVNVVSARSIIKLPKLQPPRFSGNYYDWVDFRNEFTSMIIDCNDLTDVDRFRFLKSCLTDNALQIISKIEASNNNFKNAWSALTERYDNKALIFQSHISEIIQLSTSKKESAADLRAMLDKVKAHHRALSSLGSNENLADNLLICLMLFKLDSNTIMKWEESTSKEIPSWGEFTNFLEKRACTLEKIDWNKQHTQVNYSSSNASNSNRRKPAHTAFIASRGEQKCLKCNSTEHDVLNCLEFIALNPTTRSKVIRDAKFCILCLQSNHRSRFCKAQRCDKCGGRHHSLVHWSTESEQPTASNSNLSVQRTLVISESVTNQSAMLATAIVYVFNQSGNPVPCRVVLDCAATTNFISLRCAQTLGVKFNKNSTFVRGIGNNILKPVNSCEFTFTSRLSALESFQIHAVILPKIIDMHPEFEIGIDAEIPNDIELADPEYGKPHQIDLLLGAGIFWNLLLDSRIDLGPNLPQLRETKLGWIVTGRATPKKSHQAIICAEDTTQYGSTDNLDNLVRKFWEIDSLMPIKVLLSSSDQLCEDHYNRNTRRDKFGRYIVRLPFSEEPSALGQSIGTAMRRFINLEKRFEKDENMKTLYVNFMNEYQLLGHLEEMTDFDASLPHYFLPHHGVMKPHSSSTKLRVVFDGSSKTSTGKSLNDILRSGPKLQDDLFVILLRFRLFQFVITGDIQKMFRQVLVNEMDCNYQLILWRTSTSDPIKILRLRTVTYGTTPGSYLAIKTLFRLADDEDCNFKIGANVLRKSFYVDDLMTGSNSIEELRIILNEVSEILATGGFKISKFCSNEESLLHSIDEESREKCLHIDENDVIKVLGLIWQPGSDVFRFTHQPNLTSSVTKRIVLSDMARLFDPLGLICPVITLAKIFYQDLWKLKCSWDKELNDDLREKWLKFKAELSSLKEVCIQRYVMSYSSYSRLQIHGFSDASEKAYGASVYVRCSHFNNSVSVHLLCAKSKVAPTKIISVARLELLAAKMLADLVFRLKNDVFCETLIDAEYYWTDSMISLFWITSEKYNWKTFVSHRVSKIQQLTSMDSWRHVPGELKPADMISRGMQPCEIASSNTWFLGPKFLYFDSNGWPPQKTPRGPTDDVDERKTTRIALISIPTDDATTSMNFSTNYNGVRRAFAYAIRFISNSRVNNVDRSARHILRKNLQKCEDIYSQIEPPSLDEQESAEQKFIKSIQITAFYEDYQLLKKNQPVTRASTLKNLAPFLDEKGLIRVGGRVEKAQISYNAKHQILLPKHHLFTTKLMHFFHYFRTFHAGPHLVLTSVRTKFWPISGLVLARSIVHKCVLCFRMKPKILHQIMGDLPLDRLNLNNTRPFVVTGVDFGGPFTVRHHIRCKVPKKLYIALFVCFRSKAVHIEVVPDLSAEAFIRSLKRFIADHGGAVTKIYSDNATNFRGTANYLNDIYCMLRDNSDKIHRCCQAEFIEWVFIPPRSPNFGGLWEASIKIAKRLMLNIIGDIEFTVDEFQTVVKQVAAIINSRPITPLSDNPNDLEPLTPGHFLYGGPPTALPELKQELQHLNRVKAFQTIQFVNQQFWKRFNKEYLTLLQPRTKWQNKNENIKIGTMVLVRDDTLPPLDWSLGRVIDVFPDDKGNVRVVKLKTSKGIYERSISGIAVLPSQ